jgi:hypothetical protein
MGKKLNKKNIIGKYNFRIFKSGKYYIAKGKLPDKSGTMITQGRTEKEIFDMIADAYKCLFNIN